jgi:hypothetical protein
VRGVLGGYTVLDTLHGKLLHETDRLPKLAAASGPDAPTASPSTLWGSRMWHVLLTSGDQ